METVLCFMDTCTHLPTSSEDLYANQAWRWSKELHSRACLTRMTPKSTWLYHRVIDSIESDPMMNYLRTTVCLTIARVIPDDDGDWRQEMWVLQVTDRREIAIYGTRNKWKQVQQSSEHAKECGWATFLAQKAQEEHERRHAQIAEQFAPDHFL